MLGASIRQGRRRALQLMQTGLKITRPTGEIMVDEKTLEASRDQRLLYEGVGKLTTFNAYEQNATIAGAGITVTRIRVDIPIGASLVQPGDIVEILSNPPDPLLVGVKLRVAMIAPYKSVATAQRFWCDHEHPNID